MQELRLVVTTSDYEDALRFYRDVLGLREQATFTSRGGRLTILEAGRATMEVADPTSTRWKSAVGSPVTSVSPYR